MKNGFAMRKNRLGIKKIFFIILSLFYITYIIFPLFSDITKIPVELPSMVTSFGIILLYPKAFLQKMFRWFLIYVIILVFYVQAGRPLTIGIGTAESSKLFLVEVAFMLPSVSIFLVLNYLNDKKIYKIMGFCSLLLLVLSFIYIIPILSITGDLRAESRADEEIQIPGVPTYGLMHAYTLLIPALCYGVRYSVRFRKYLMMFILLLYAYLIMKTSVTTSIIVMIIATFFSFLYSERSAHSVFVILSFLAIFIYLFYLAGGFVALIDWVYPFFDGTSVASKLDDFRRSLNLGHLEGRTMSVRGDLHQQSWDCFFQNPILGVPKVGGHSNFIDRLGGMGLVAFIPYFMIFFSYYEALKKTYMIKKMRMFSYLTLLVAFIFIYQKGNWGDASWLFLIVIAPSVLFLFDEERTCKRGNNIKLVS